MLQVSDEVALRVLAVRTDAVTGLPLDVYQEPPTARFRPPGEMLHIPGASTTAGMDEAGVHLAVGCLCHVSWAVCNMNIAWCLELSRGAFLLAQT